MENFSLSSHDAGFSMSENYLKNHAFLAKN